MQEPQIKFQPFLAVGASYSTGMSGVALNSQGQLTNADLYGASFSGGISGSHSWRHTSLGLNYHANYTIYSGGSAYNSFNQGLDLGLTHQVAHHIKFDLREATGWYSGEPPSAGLTQTVPFDPSQSAVPVNNVYYDRTIFSTTQADLVIQKSARLSFDLGGGLFINRHASSALYGVTGEEATGDVQYRVTRHSTIGVNYSYTHYSFTGVLSSSDIQGAAITYATRFSRSVEFSAYGGFMHAETEFVQNVPVDPNVAALLGYTSTSALVYHANWVPNFSGRLSKSFAHGMAYASGGETVTPGNGIFLTSRTLSATAGYGYTGLRHWSMFLSCSYTSALSIGNVAGAYGAITGTFGMSRSLGHSLSLTMNYSASQYRSPNFTLYNHLIYTGTVGIAWSPGEIPLRIW
jgi:hypothetical protein